MTRKREIGEWFVRSTKGDIIHHTDAFGIRDAWAAEFKTTRWSGQYVTVPERWMAVAICEAGNARRKPKHEKHPKVAPRDCPVCKRQKPTPARRARRRTK